uniref:Uncharacterized protein n=1 Tax=Caenorhabditis japonica TaxID=281687 RepID=A0A8R1INB1_CAEJA
MRDLINPHAPFLMDTIAHITWPPHPHRVRNKSVARGWKAPSRNIFISSHKIGIYLAYTYYKLDALYLYHVFTNELCKRQSDVPQFITAVSQQILRNSGKIAEHWSVVCTPRS